MPLFYTVFNQYQKIAKQMDAFLNSYIRMLDTDTMKQILQNQKCDETCQQLHAGNCNVKALIQFMMGVKSVFKMYLLVHIIPLLLFKLKRIKKNPKQQLKKALKGLVKSLLFAGCSSMIVRRSVCLLTKYSCYNWTICRYPASISSVSILFESATRQIQISLFCFAKGWETAYLMFKRRHIPIQIPCGNLIINGFSLAIIGFIYMNHPDAFRQTYRKLMGLLLSDV